MNYSGNKITIIGAVRSGIGAAKLIKRLNGIPFVSDVSDNEKIRKSVDILKALNIDYELGGHTSRVYDCEVMVVSPGVPQDSEIIKTARNKKIQLISELELASSVCKGNIIAITGTNGKTTTTSLCGHVFNGCGAKTYTAGNIGLAFSEIALDVKENEFAAVEVSSFQLDLIDKFKPEVAAILNITPDHLNRYENNYQNYINSKMKIFENQDEKDYLIINRDNEILINSLTQHSSTDYYFSLSMKSKNGCFQSGEEIVFVKDDKEEFRCSLSDINLRGEHNYANAMAVIIAAKIFGFDNEKIIEGLRTFKGVEHRLEFVREINGVKYINDSKATNVDSVWYALRSFDQPIYLILGGQDKGNDYNQIKDLVLSKVKKIYAIGSSAEKVFNFFHHDVKVEIKQSLEDVITAVNSEARESEIVLLSPACASFDMFNDYEHRGKVFKEAVNNL
jgi:UDP-N-acetylmuramoylalanine--D-glutamate ligase